MHPTLVASGRSRQVFEQDKWSTTTVNSPVPPQALKNVPHKIPPFPYTTINLNHGMKAGDIHDNPLFNDGF